MLLVSAGTLPLSYVFERGRALHDRYPNVGEIRTATLNDNGVEIQLANSFLRLLPFAGTKVRFFTSAQRDTAIRWLLEQT